MRHDSPTALVTHLLFFFFFFQAEDGIRDLTVTGVQTCALPISPSHRCRAPLPWSHHPPGLRPVPAGARPSVASRGAPRTRGAPPPRDPVAGTTRPSSR